MSAWSRFYEPKMTALYRSNLKRKYQPFLDLITAYKPSHLVEAGCGAGHITRLLLDATPTASHTCVDRDRQMLNLASRNIAEAPGSQRVRFALGDIRKRSERATSGNRLVIHSHGVLEHLRDEHIRSVTHNHSYSGVRAVHYVPSSKYGSKSFGDERLMSKDRWGDLCRPTRIVEFNQGFDLALVWE